MGAIAAIAVLLAGAPALAHFGVLPGVVASGEVAQLVVELPAAAPAPVSVRIEGAGIETLSSRPAEAAPGGEPRWSIRARVDAPAGPLPIAVRATAADGGSATFRATLVVVSGGSSSAFPWVPAVLSAALALGLALGVRRLVRRRA